MKTPPHVYFDPILKLLSKLPWMEVSVSVLVNQMSPSNNDSTTQMMSRSGMDTGCVGSDKDYVLQGQYKQLHVPLS